MGEKVQEFPSNEHFEQKVPTQDGMRPVSALVLFALGSVVLWMSGASSVLALCLALTLIRGFGQSMLSVVSLAIIGKSFPHRPGNAMGAYAVLLTFLMAAWTGLLGYRVTIVGWRIAWSEVGWGVFMVLPIVWFCTPRYLQMKSLQGAADSPHQENAFATLAQAIATPCFWIFALGISLQELSFTVMILPCGYLQVQAAYWE